MSIKGHLRAATIGLAAMLTLPTTGAAAGRAPEAIGKGQKTMETAPGIRMLSVRDPVQKTDVPLVVFYPTSEKPSKLQFGPFGIEAAKDASFKGDRLALVVISH